MRLGYVGKTIIVKSSKAALSVSIGINRYRLSGVNALQRPLGLADSWCCVESIRFSFSTPPLRFALSDKP